MSDKYKIDDIDKKILAIIKENARIQWREIGEEIHMTGQAIGERIKKLTQNGIIKGYHATIDSSIIDEVSIDYITVIMTTGNHKGFLELVSSLSEVTEIYKTSGYGCYLLRVETSSKESLDQLLQTILHFGNYQVSSVITKYK